MTKEINLSPVIEKLRKGVCRRVTEGRPAVVVDIEETEHFMRSVADILSALTPPAEPVSRPGDGVEGDGPLGEVPDSALKIATDLHAAYEQLIYGLPKYLDAENLTDEENMIREAYITLDVTAHRLAALTPPAEPVSRPAGEGEREAGDYTMALAERQAFEDHTDLAAHIERMATTGRIGSMIEWDGFLRSLNIALLRPAAPDAGGGWMPIETAPKDGTEILVAPHMTVVAWDFGAEQWVVGIIPLNRDRTIADDWTVQPAMMFEQYLSNWSVEPTHWMPLPAPPAL